MSFLLEALGCGLVGDLFRAAGQLLPAVDERDALILAEQIGAENTSAEAKVRLACAMLSEPDNQSIQLAHDLLEYAVQEAPNCFEAHLGLACVADRLAHNGTTEHHLSRALVLRPEDPILMFSLALTFEKLDRRKEAEKLYENTLRVCPALRNARERLAALQILNGELAAAARHYRLLASGRPGQLGPRLLHAALLLAAGEVGEALVAHEEALTLEATSWESDSEGAWRLAKEGRFEEAVAWLRRAIEEEPSNADLHVHLGDMLVKAGRDREALTAFTSAVELCPDFLEASVKVGTHCLRLGRLREASQWFSRAVEVNDRLLVGYIGLSVTHHEAGNMEACAETLEMAAGIEPNSSLLFSEAARLGLKGEVTEVRPGREGDLEDSDDTLAQLAVKTCSVSDVLDLLDEMIVRTRSALSSHSNHARLHYQLALLLRNRGRVEQANEMLTMALRINPSYTQASIKLGLGLRETGRPEDAMECFKDALRYDARTTALHHRLGLMFSQQPGFDYAHQQYQMELGERAEEMDLAANLELALEQMKLASCGSTSAVIPEIQVADSLRWGSRFGRRM
ncbi:MAG: tetratricopeptide repeat protein [Phycisphaerales bacterium]|nr:MAG: tetratricopeptide repeat protein [Phycisphaerales bacterium]